LSPSFRYLIESRDEIPFKGGRLWRPRFLINPNSQSAANSGQIMVNLGPHLEKLTNLL
jgi:hypothetical protein